MTFHHILLNTNNTKTYEFRNLGHCMKKAIKYSSIKPINGVSLSCQLDFKLLY
jgi:hypothetical protein